MPDDLQLLIDKTYRDMPPATVRAVTTWTVAEGQRQQVEQFLCDRHYKQNIEAPETFLKNSGIPFEANTHETLIDSAFRCGHCFDEEFTKVKIAKGYR